jgi:hypothetical protein
MNVPKPPRPFDPPPRPIKGPPHPIDPADPDNDPARGSTPEHRDRTHPKLPPVDPVRLEQVKAAVETWMETKGGVRQEGVWPYLLIRGVVGDQGVRPFPQGTVFWESPDIKLVEGNVGVLTNQTPTLSPIAGRDHTVFVHVWNLGRLASFGTRVSVYWCSPGVAPVPPTLIGSVLVDLPDKTHADCHVLVRIPQLWNPIFVNDGHECLWARVEGLLDGAGTDFDSLGNRHFAQQNLHLAFSPVNITRLLATLSDSVPSGAELHLLHGMGAIKDVVAAHVPSLGIGLVPPLTPPKRAAMLPNGVVHLGAVAGAHTPQARYIPPEMFARWKTQIITPALLKDAANQRTRVIPVGAPIPSDLTKAAAALLAGLGIHNFEAGAIARALGDSPNAGHLLRFEARQGDKVIGGYSVIVTQTKMRGTPDPHRSS